MVRAAVRGAGGRGEELQALRARAAALEAELLAEIDAQATAKRQLAWGSTGDWFTHTAGTTRWAGKRTVVHAKRLVSERSATLAALRDGDVSPDQAEVIVAGIEQLPLTGTSPRSSTPRRPTGRPKPRWTVRNAPPTSAAACRSPTTAPAGSA